MTCIDDGILRAHLDGELAGAELAQVTEHLISCADCRACFAKLHAERAQMEALLTTLAPPADSITINSAMAYARFNNLYQPDPLTGEAKLVERVSKKGSDPLPW